MDYIREFDIRLEREMFYAGETLQGNIVLDTVENFKLRAIRVVLRGKGHAEWKVIVSGDRRTVKDDQYFIDDRSIIWGKDKPEGNVPILPRGHHTFPFKFQLPESSLPCSFESKNGTIRYYIKVTVDIPYASPPQGMKYFTLIGPHIDCMEDQYLKPMVGQEKRSVCCLCCKRGPVSFRTQLERTAYVCGESIKLKADIENQSNEEIRLKLKLVQYVEYFIDRGVLGVTKDIQHPVLEYTGDPVPSGTRWKFDSSGSLVVPVMPPTLVSVCRLVQIYYVLKVYILLSQSGEDLHMHFPITIATVPFRIPNSIQQPHIAYSVCCDHVEGGMYIGPEFQLGQVYDGNFDPSGNATGDPVVLYRPVYVCVPNPKLSNIQTPKKKYFLKLDPKGLKSGGEFREQGILESSSPSPRSNFSLSKDFKDALSNLTSKDTKDSDHSNSEDTQQNKECKDTICDSKSSMDSKESHHANSHDSKEPKESHHGNSHASKEPKESRHGNSHDSREPKDSHHGNSHDDKDSKESRHEGSHDSSESKDSHHGNSHDSRHSKDSNHGHSHDSWRPKDSKETKGPKCVLETKDSKINLTDPKDVNGKTSTM